MTDAERHERNEKLLGQCHPGFARPLRATLLDVESVSRRPRIDNAWRSPAEQLAKYKANLSHIRYGFHCATGPTGKPESLAVDLVDEDHPLDPPLSFALVLLWAARRHGLTTGLLFGLPANLQRPLIAAADERRFSFVTKVIGWDRMHVEITSLTVAQVKGGMRPPV